MSMTYQQQYVLDGLAGRAAILDLTSRHNRAHFSGDLVGWITTFRHSGASYTRAGETFNDLRDAFDGGDRQRLVSVDHEITVDGVDATQRCIALLFRDNELRATAPTSCCRRRSPTANCSASIRLSCRARVSARGA